MEFILSQFLWLLPISLIPVLINYVNNRKYKTLKFSSTFLMDFVKTKSMKKISFLNLLILIIRVLIILFLILSVSRPVIKSPINFSSDASSQSVVLIVDDSFSNTTPYLSPSRLSNIKETIEKIVSYYDKKANFELLSSSKSLIYQGNIENFDINRVQLENTFNDGNLDIITKRYFNEDYTGRFISHNMYIITDTDSNFFSNFNFNESVWDIIIIDSSSGDSYPLIKNVSLLEEVILPFEPFKILVEVYNPSENIYDDLRLKVNVDNMIQTSDNFSMQPFSTKTITINSLIDKVGSFEIVTEIDYNSDISGVKFYLLQQSIPNLDICFLNIDANIKAYFEAAISSIGLGETITLSDCSFYFDEIINFDIVISHRFDLIDSDNFNLYSQKGGHLIFIPKLENLLNDVVLFHTKTAIRKNNILSTKIYRNIFENMINDTLFVTSEKYILPINQSSIIANENGSFWNRVQKNNGLIDLLGIPLKISESDFAIKAFFVPFIHFLIFSKENQFSRSIYFDDTLKDFLETFKIEEKNNILISSKQLKNEILMSKYKQDLISVPGNYYFSNYGDTLNQISVNVSNAELEFKKIDFNNILKENSKISLLRMDSNFKEEFDNRIATRELWSQMLLLAMLFLMAETILINATKKK